MSEATLCMSRPHFVLVQRILGPPPNVLITENSGT